MKKRIGTALILFLISLFSYLIYDFVSYRSEYAVSDAAFVKSDLLLTLGFKVGGKVVKLNKKEGDSVKKGELLALLDKRDFVLAKKRVEKEILSLQNKIDSLEIKKQILKVDLDVDQKIKEVDKAVLLSNIDSLKSQIDANRAKYLKILKDLKRFLALYKKHLISKSSYEELKSQKEYLQNIILSQEAKLKALKKSLQKADFSIFLAKKHQKKLKELTFTIKSLKSKKEALEAAKKEIENKIDYCHLYSPIDGVVAKRFINLDHIVDKGSPIYAVVNREDIYVEVLLGEKKLEGVRVGNSVKIKIDAFKDREYRGVVKKILPASAATFALVPRDIASGEFTKLEQRFAVRIAILNPTKDLRVGMGASVAIKRN